MFFKSIKVQYRSRLTPSNLLCIVNSVEIQTRGISEIKVTYGQVAFEQKFLLAEDINEQCIIMTLHENRDFWQMVEMVPSQSERKASQTENLSCYAQFLCH
jgi:hypothetical protein